MDHTLLTRKEVAQLYRISIASVYNYVQTGQIPAYRIGKSLRFKKDDVEQALKKITPPLNPSHNGQ